MYSRLSLELHLKETCQGNPKYSQLSAAWELDKRIFKEMLATIPYNYCHYSLHEASHADSVINKIEMVLGEERIKQLGPTDTWMLLQVAYVHDFGMVISDKKLREVWQSEKFQEYIQNVRKSKIDKDLQRAASFIQGFSEGAESQTIKRDFPTSKDWPVELRRAVVLLTADYFRKTHHDYSRAAINGDLGWNIDFSHNGLIIPRIIKMLGRIAQLHGKNFDDLMNLEYQNNGVGTDHFHPRFIACLLR